MRLERQSVHAFLAQAEIAPAKAAQVLDPRRLEPDQVGSVVGDALGIRLGEADCYGTCEFEVGHLPVSIAAAVA